MNSVFTEEPSWQDRNLKTGSVEVPAQLDIQPAILKGVRHERVK